MRYLKRRLEAARISYLSKKVLEKPVVLETITKSHKIKKSPFESKKRKKRRAIVRQDNIKTKNVVKNFGRAIANFAASGLALHYIDTLPQAHNINLANFKIYANKMRDYVQNIDNFRKSLILSEEDNDETKVFKIVFKHLAEIFVKYFSVNWIFSGKLHYRKVYLKHRGSILRRIKNPDSFTYLTKIK